MKDSAVKLRFEKILIKPPPLARQRRLLFNIYIAVEGAGKYDFLVGLARKTMKMLFMCTKGSGELEVGQRDGSQGGVFLWFCFFFGAFSNTAVFFRNILQVIIFFL